MILFALALAWLAGAGFGAAGFDDAYLFALACGAGAAAAFVYLRRWRMVVLAAGATLLFVLGLFRLVDALPSDRPAGVALLNDRAAVGIRGVVDQDPEQRQASQRIVIEVDEANDGAGWQASSGKVLATLRPFPRFAYGDRLELTARLDTPPAFDGFDYREYLARRGISSTTSFPEARRIGAGGGSRVTAAIISIRNHLGEPLSLALPEPEAALARGMLLGQRFSIPGDVTDDFNRAGISHLIAISGSNVSIVAELVLVSLAWLIGRRRAVVTSMLFIAAFVLLVGASPSVMRAGTMGVMMLGAVLAGRPGSALTAVAFAAAVLTAAWPLSILDVSFQLSFAATVGLIVLQEPLYSRLLAISGRVMPAGLASAFSRATSVTGAASLAIFPITAANFQRVSLVAIPANMVAVPLFTATLILSAMTSLAGLVSHQAGAVAERFAIVPLWLLVEIAHGFAALPYASIALAGPGLAGSAVLYGAIVCAAWLLARQRLPALDARALHIGPALPAAALVLFAAAFVWMEALAQDGGELRVAVLDVGQGDSILIATPSGRRILVDGGPSGATLLRDLSRELPRGARRIDLIVVTHPQEDHIAGFVDVLERYDVGAAIVSGTSSDIGAYKAWLQEVATKHVPVTAVVAGQTADLGGGVRLEVLSPRMPYLTGTEDDLNNNAVILRLSYGSVSFLLASDLGTPGEVRLLSQPGDLHATVLKVGHHGSETSTTDELLTAVHPSVAVISVGADNTYGHPSPTTLLRLAGIPTYRTDRNGTVRFETDGSHLYVHPDHGAYKLIPSSSGK